MKKLLLTTVFSLGLLATPAWGVWYSVDDHLSEGYDDDMGTVPVKIREIDIYFKKAKGSKVLPGDDDEDKVGEIENLLRGKEQYSITFMRPTEKEHLKLMKATLIKFELKYEDIHCYEPTPAIKTAWDALYQKTKRQIDQEEDDKQERDRAQQEDFDDLLESNGPGVEIMKARGGYFSDSD